MAVDQARSFAMRNDVADDDVSDCSGRRLVRLHRKAEAFAPALNGEVDGITVAPPEPVKTVGVDHHVRDHDVFHNAAVVHQDRKSTRLNSSHGYISYAVFCLKKKKKKIALQSTYNSNIT